LHTIILKVSNFHRKTFKIKIMITDQGFYVPAFS
jgi:hypothetical protein